MLTCLDSWNRSSTVWLFDLIETRFDFSRKVLLTCLDANSSIGAQRAPLPQRWGLGFRSSGSTRHEARGLGRSQIWDSEPSETWKPKCLRSERFEKRSEISDLGCKIFPTWDQGFISEVLGFVLKPLILVWGLALRSWPSDLKYWASAVRCWALAVRNTLHLTPHTGTSHWHFTPYTVHLLHVTPYTMHLKPYT